MKKLFASTLIFLFILELSVQAQFVQGYGITAGGTLSNQIWKFDSLDLKIKQKYKLGWNVSVFGEFFDHEYYRWISEFQYNRKGGIEKYPVPDRKDKDNYLCWNNFLKLRQELYDVTPYLLLGPRVEYLLSTNQVGMRKLHLSASAGIGMEFLYKDPYIFFAEFHYNPDVMQAYKSPFLKIRNNAYELRIGLKFHIKGKSFCPPVFT